MTASKFGNNYILSSEVPTTEVDQLTGLVLTSNAFESLLGNAITGGLYDSKFTPFSQKGERITRGTLANYQRDSLIDYTPDSSSIFTFDNFVSDVDTFSQPENLISDGDGINTFLNSPSNQLDFNTEGTEFVTRQGGLVVVPRDPSRPAPGYNFPELAPWLDNDPNTPSDIPSSLSTNIVKSNKALILDPFRQQFEPFGDTGDEANNIEDTLNAAGFIVTRKTNSNVTIEDFKNLDQYGVIAIVSHGARVEWLTGNVIYDHPNFSNPDRSRGQVVVLTGVIATPTNLIKYRSDINQGRLVQVELGDQKYLAITPSFITQYTQSLPNSLIYVGACDSTYNNTLAGAFINKGAGAFVGYSRVVASAFADPHGRAMFNSLVADRTTSEITGIDVNRDPVLGALFDLSLGSATDLTINIGLRNGTFEIDNLSAWVAQGNAGAINTLGPLLAPQGEEMAFISTASSSSSIDLTAFRGQEVDLIFRTFDRGDALFETAALIDNIQITTI